jgi:hypothetical protein
VGRLLEADLVFTWCSAYRGNADAGVPLVRVTREPSTELEVDASVRVLSRPFARPHLGSGQTIPGLAPWEPWEFGVQTRVDTSAAGFTRVPCYFAVLTSTRLPIPLPVGLPPLFKTYITDPGLSSFTLRVVLRTAPLQALMPEASRAYGLTVCWIGCQEPDVLPPGCPAQVATPASCTTDDFGIDTAPGGQACGCGCGCHGR